MAKDHLKRLAAPKTWQIKRKTSKFVTKPAPGPHSIGLAMPLNTIMKELLGYAQTTREVKKIINTGCVKVDGRPRKDFRYPVGVFDTLEFTSTGEHFRALIDKKGRLTMIKSGKSESSAKPCKITGKTMVRGKMQLNLYDGKNILVDKGTFNVGDTIMISLPDQKISKHLKLEKKSTIFLIGGKHMGETGIVGDIIQNKIIYKDNSGNLVETSKKYAFVIGDSKPLIALE